MRSSFTRAKRHAQWGLQLPSKPFCPSEVSEEKGKGRQGSSFQKNQGPE